MKEIHRYLNSERDGFSGLNHVLIAIMLFLLLLLIPIEPFSSFIAQMTASPVFAIMSFLIVCGGALLVDLDNLKSAGGSAASWDLGVLGSILSSVMVTVSSVVTSIFHGKKDVRPNTQHRFFWHTLFVPIVMFLLMFFFLPSSDIKISDRLFPFSVDNMPTSAFIVLFLVGVCVYVGSMQILKRLKNLPFVRIKPSLASTALMLLSILICVFVCTEKDLKLLAYCVALGYLFHLIGDLFADGGIPALFPLSGIAGKFFMRVHLLPKALTVKTGSTVESMLKVVFFVIDLVLFYFVISKIAVF